MVDGAAVEGVEVGDALSEEAVAFRWRVVCCPLLYAFLEQS